MVMTDMLSDDYGGKRVLVTGHTGFKGSWLCCWLRRLGAEVAGYSLPPVTKPSHHELLAPKFRQWTANIGNRAAVDAAFREFRPKVVFHMAAQAIVRQSYRDPVETYESNVMGLVNVLDACRRAESVRAVVAVTSDKCYLNREQASPYREEDRLGGHDPYSASKACAELIVDSYRKSFLDRHGIGLASARAGNVIGGGDWAEDRLVPDLVRALAAGNVLSVRSPEATRPWQHVLDPLGGYLLLGLRLLQGEASFADAWNFGPDAAGNLTVIEILNMLQSYWPNVRYETGSREDQPHEARQLALDSSKARRLLEWRPVWNADQAVRRTADWYRAYSDRQEIVTLMQIEEYSAAMQAGVGS